MPVAPVTEPVSLDEAKNFMRIDADYSFDDGIILMMITANREYLEGELGLSLVPKTGLKYKYTRPCCGQIQRVYLPYGPVTNVVYTNTDDVVQDAPTNLSPDDYYPAYRLYYSGTLTYDAGNWGSAFPAGLKLALLMRVATNYENRENFVVGQTVNEVTQNADQMAFKYSRNLYL